MNMHNNVHFRLSEYAREHLVQGITFTAETNAVDIRCSSGYWHSALRPHNAGAPSTTLANNTPVRRFQVCHTCSSVAVRKFCVVLS